MEKYLLEVHNSLIKEIPLRKDENDLLRVGMRVPVIRKHLKDSCFTFLEESNQKILSSWDFIWKNSVGWVAYTTKPDDLKKAFENSSYVEIAVIDSRVVGIIRTLSDSVSIHYIQDIIVHPEFQRYGVGRHLLKSELAFYADVRTHILLTDNEERQKLFYESLGFKNSKDLKKYELNSFL